MPDSSWLSVFGAIGGAIGAISGLIGSFLGYKGYRRAHKDKALDLRLQLGRAVSDARGVVGGLLDVMDKAHTSRRAVLAATGRAKSGIMTNWTKNWIADRNSVVSLSEEFSGLDRNYTAMTDHGQLESGLAAVYDLTRRASEFQAKYEAEIADDDKTRDRLAAADPRYQAIGRTPPGI